LSSKHPFTLVFSTAIVGISVSLAGFAQHLPDAGEEANRELEEVIVTARFREESIQDIGASIAAYDESLITREGLLSLQDVSLRTVGMDLINLGPNINDINIRGISNALPTGRGMKTLTATFMDDVIVSGLGSGAANDFNTFDLSRIEILRGPQPTHFGEGSVGGTVRYFTNDPDLNAGYSGTVRAGFSSTRHGDTSWRADAALTVPVIKDQLAFRLVGYHEDQGGFIDLPNLGKNDANDFDSDGLRAVMLWQPKDELSVRLSANFNRLDYGETNEIDPTQDGLDGSLDNSNLYSAASIVADNSDDYDLYTLKLAYDFDAFTVESISGYFDRELSNRAENSANTVGFSLFLENAFGVTDIDTTVLSSGERQEETFSQEFRLISAFEGPVNFTAGLYYKDSDLEPFNWLTSEGMSAILVPTTSTLLYSDTTEETKQSSAFVELTWSATNRLRFIGGVRYVREDFTTTINESLVIQPAEFLGFDPETGYPQFPVRSDLDTLASFGLGNSFEFDLREWLPRAGFEYDLSEDMLFYGSAARGLRNGGLNPVVSAAFEASDPDTGEFDEGVFQNALEYAEDTVDTVEFGLKTLFNDGRGSINSAVYVSDYQDPQVLVGVPFFGKKNAPDVDIWGVEIESLYSLSDNWTAFANIAYLDAEFSDSMKLSNVSDVPEDYEDLQEGNRPANTPEWTAAIGADFDYPFRNKLSFFGHGSFSYVDERYGSAQNFPSTEFGSMEILNLRLGIRSEQWSLTAYGNNLLNDLEKQASVAPSNGAFIDENGELDANLSQVFVNRPMTVGLMLQFYY
jgi:iron complex outermembrane receptor protein